MIQDPDSGECICENPDYVYIPESGGCFAPRDCPQHGHQSGDACVCDTGYDFYGTDECHVTKDCHNGVQQGDSCVCNLGWAQPDCSTCKEGYKQSGTECVCHGVSSKPSNCITETTCQSSGGQTLHTCTQCDEGYVVSSDGTVCVPTPLIGKNGPYNATTGTDATINIVNTPTGTAPENYADKEIRGLYWKTTEGNNFASCAYTTANSGTTTGIININNEFEGGNSPIYGMYVDGKERVSEADKGTNSELAYANTPDNQSGKAVSDISITNTSDGDVYGAYLKGESLHGAYAKHHGTAESTITITNTGNGNVYGTSSIATCLSHSAGSGDVATTKNTINITNTGTGNVYGALSTGDSQTYARAMIGAHPTSQDKAYNTITIKNTNLSEEQASSSYGGASVGQRRSVYGMMGYRVNGAYTTGASSIAQNTLTITNYGPSNVYGIKRTGVTDGAGSHGAYNEKGGNPTNTISIINHGSGNIYGIHTASDFIGANTETSITDGNASNTISIQNIGSGSVYGMYGQDITSSAGPRTTNEINLFSVPLVSNNVATGTITGIYASNYGLNNVADTMTINSMGGNYIKKNMSGTVIETVSALTDNTVVTGMYVPQNASATNAGTITIKRETWTDDQGTLDESDDITYQPQGNKGKAYGIYVEGNNTSTGKKVSNSGTITISGIDNAYGIYVENGTNVNVENSGTIDVSGNNAYGIYANAISINITNKPTGKIIVNNQECTGTNCTYNDEKHWIYVTGNSTLSTSGIIMSPTSLNLQNLSETVVAQSRSRFSITNNFSGVLHIDPDTVTKGFKTVYTEKDMIQAGNTSGLRLVSDSALFDAKLADNGHDVKMTMKAFDTVTTNKSLADFLSKNYALGNNEAFYNKLKSFGNIDTLTDSLNKLTGKDVLKRFNLEDMTMMRELNFDMNEKLFHCKEQHLVSTGSVSPMAFRGDTGSNSKYSLYNKRDGNTSIGLGVAFTNIRSDDAHKNNDRQETSYQLILPMGYKTNGFNLITSPRIGYARGTYDRTGFDEKTYEGILEKRVFGLMNEVRYPITVGKWKLEPSAEFNILCYQQKGHEEAKEFALYIQNQNTLSVEGGIGLYATREEELDKDTTLKLTTGVAVYHEFADPYRLKVGMNGMDGAFTLYDERRSSNRGVIRAGFDYVYSDLSLYGSLNSYIDRETRTSAKTGMKIKF